MFKAIFQLAESNWNLQYSTKKNMKKNTENTEDGSSIYRGGNREREREKEKRAFFILGFSSTMAMCVCL